MNEERNEYRHVDVRLGDEVLRGQRAEVWERRRLPRTVRYETYVTDFAWAFARFCFAATLASAGLWMLATVDEAAWEADGLVLALLPALWAFAAAGFGGGIALWVRAAQFNTYMEELENVKLAPREDEGVEGEARRRRVTRVEIAGGDGRLASFQQPAPGEFANWLAAVLRDADDADLGAHEKTTLSQNRGLRRGWPREMYKDMLAQLYLMGWFSEGANRTPEVTGEGRRVLIAWLRNAPPPALS